MILVMEYCSGGELYDYLSQKKVLQEDEARRSVSGFIFMCILPLSDFYTLTCTNVPCLKTIGIAHGHPHHQRRYKCVPGLLRVRDLEIQNKSSFTPVFCGPVVSLQSCRRPILA